MRRTRTGRLSGWSFWVGDFAWGFRGSRWFQADVWVKIRWRKVQKNIFKKLATVATGEMRKNIMQKSKSQMLSGTSQNFKFIL